MTEHLGVPLERAVRLYGDREAVVDADHRWSYRELGRNVAGFDAGLDDLGLGAGDVVGVLSANSAMHLLAWLAVPRSGRVLNDLNTRLAPAELEFILSDSDARVLLVDDGFAEVGRALAAACPQVEHLIHTGSGPTPDGMLGAQELLRRPPAPARPPGPDALAGIFYTGGTTGRPKGAMLSHRNLLSNAKHVLIALGYGTEDAYLHAGPMFHLADGATTYALTWVGGRHVVTEAFTPQGWAEAIEAEHVTRTMLVPTMIAMVLDDERALARDLSSLTGMLYGASPMSDRVLSEAMAAIDCDWTQCYGMTEAAPAVSFLTAADHRRGRDGGPEAARRLRSAGRPGVGVEVEIRDEEGAAVAPGEVGEIWLRGPNVMQGYWRREAETATALTADGWYRSGDAASMDADGYLFIVDRVKDMIISGGENVYCTEVENALHQHADVAECAVFGVPDDRWGERVHAAVVLRAGAAVDADGLIEHCRERIAGYKLPRSVDLHDGPLPKSGAGKLLKRELRAPFWAGVTRQVS